MEFTSEILNQLEQRYGIPLYVFDERSFRTNFLALENAMKGKYPNYRIAYSYKTNYTPYILETVKSMGGIAEVVSGMEYRLAKRIGYRPEDIIFNGPEKGADGIRAFLEGCRMNADHLGEVEQFCRTAESYPERTFQIGLRVNLDLGQSFLSRFGMDDDELKQSFQRVAQTDNIRVSGLHCHISRCRDLGSWRKRTEKMLSASDRFFADAPEYIDLGSGMYADMEPDLACQFNNVPTYQDYASVTAEMIAAHYRGLPEKQKPVLLTEPGTTLVNRYMSVIARVQSIKSIRGKYFAVLDCSMHNLGETCILKRIPIRIIPMGNRQSFYEDMDLVGYTCLEQDILYSGYRGRIAVGDLVVFSNTGGYSTVLKPPFIRPNFAMVAVKPNGQIQLIREEEKEQQLLQTYLFSSGESR